MNIAGFTKTYDVDQGKVLGNNLAFQLLYDVAPGVPNGKREGICSGLSMIWVARHMMFKGESPAERFKTIFSTGGFRFGGKSQDTHVAASAVVPGGKTWQEYMVQFYADALKTYVLKVKDDSTSVWNIDLSTGVDHAADINVKVNRTHNYFLINMGLTAGGKACGHMVACYKSGGTLGMNSHLYFFDPNMGEYKVRAKDITNFFSAFLAAYGAVFESVNYFCAFGVERG